MRLKMVHEAKTNDPRLLAEMNRLQRAMGVGAAMVAPWVAGCGKGGQPAPAGPGEAPASTQVTKPMQTSDDIKDVGNGTFVVIGRGEIPGALDDEDGAEVARERATENATEKLMKHLGSNSTKFKSQNVIDQQVKGKTVTVKVRFVLGGAAPGKNGAGGKSGEIPEKKWIEGDDAPAKPKTGKTWVSDE